MSSLDVFQCPVCWQRYSDPHMLPGCGHTFCRTCIEGLSPEVPTSTYQHSSTVHRFKCPICRDTFRSNTQRPNFALRQLMADASGFEESESTIATVPNSSQVGHQACTRDVQLPESDDARKTAALTSLGVPPQLAQVLVEEDRHIGLRIFVLDNSGSTAIHDGHIFKIVSDSTDERFGCNPMTRVDCTRWEEIKHMAMEQAEWAAMMGTPCEFRLLNTGPPPLREGVDFARVNIAEESSVCMQEQLANLSTMLEKVQPQGHTPIAERLNEVYTRIQQDHRELVGLGQRVVVVLATDGCPTSKGSGGKSTSADKQQVVQCIKRLTTELPVFMVVRLTCDEDDVISFYNELDAYIELNLEVLDDMENEAKEVRSNGNGWLTYSPMIHKIREGGTFLKLLDVLDERPLTAIEILLLSKLLLTPENQDAEAFREKLAVQGDSQDSEKLVDVLAEYNKDAAAVYSPHHRRMVKPVDIEQVRSRVVSPLMRAKQAFTGVCNAIKTLYPTKTFADMARDALFCDQKQLESVRAVKFLEQALA